MDARKNQKSSLYIYQNSNQNMCLKICVDCAFQSWQRSTNCKTEIERGLRNPFVFIDELKLEFK